MYQHGPACLEGPRFRVRDWWMQSPSVALEGTPSLTGPKEMPIRWELVARVRREIAAGTYDTPEKLEAALRVYFNRLD